MGSFFESDQDRKLTDYNSQSGSLRQNYMDMYKNPSFNPQNFGRPLASMEDLANQQREEYMRNMAMNASINASNTAADISRAGYASGLDSTLTAARAARARGNTLDQLYSNANLGFMDRVAQGRSADNSGRLSAEQMQLAAFNQYDQNRLAALGGAANQLNTNFAQAMPYEKSTSTFDDLLSTAGTVASLPFGGAGATVGTKLLGTDWGSMFGGLG